MAQPVSAYQWARVLGTAAGTTTIKSGYGELAKVLVGTNTPGTITLYDSNSGTNASFMASIATNIGTAPKDLSINARVKNGITVVTSAGTSDVLITFD